MLSSPSGRVCSLSVGLPPQPRMLVKGRHAGGGGGELAGVVVGDKVDMFEEQLVEHASDVVGCVVVMCWAMSSA